jgi:O-antigen/teichoic acid export membrane protein
MLHREAQCSEPTLQVLCMQLPTLVPRYLSKAKEEHTLRTLGKIVATLGVIGAIAVGSAAPAAAWYGYHHRYYHHHYGYYHHRYHHRHYYAYYPYHHHRHHYWY